MKLIFPLILLLPIWVSGCSDQEEGSDGMYGIVPHIAFGDGTAVIEFRTPWYQFEKELADGDRLGGLDCEKWYLYPDWWLQVTARTSDGQLIGRGNWTHMENKGGYDLFIRSDGSLELALERSERKYHDEPVPVPSRP